ncbi:MAG: SAM-dependent methyltransferase [Spirochaetaceae bacterium]|nr:SAM-dependent methyltransferase [Spirochaetaceae bacterium]
MDISVTSLIDELKNSADKIVSVTFSASVKSNPVSKEFCPIPEGKNCIRIKIKPAKQQFNDMFFAEYFTETQTFHKNINSSQLFEMISSLSADNFKSVVIRLIQDSSKIEVISLLANKKGNIRIIKNQEKIADNSKSVKKTLEDDKKNYLLQEGTAVPFLVYLGVMTETGKVVNSKYDKFKQINRFLEFIDDILPGILKIAGNINESRPLKIVDFGCGKSYLTFAVHYFLTEIKKLPVEIFGLDLKDDVITTCNNLVKKLNCKGLTFSKGDIAEYSKNQSNHTDLMITLHACDTATDYALEYAIKNNCTAILSVPCCQHEVNAQLDIKKADSLFEPLLRYGLIKERFASLVTDVTRCSILENAGYNVQVLEFIDMSHTPKNILIRAIKRTNPGNKSSTSQEMNEKLKITTTLERQIQSRAFNVTLYAGKCEAQCNVENKI